LGTKKTYHSLPYEKGFDEEHIPTKVRPTEMNFKLLEHYKKRNSKFA